MALEVPPLQFARGLAAGIPTGSDGEPLWTTDTLRLYVAQSSVNYPVVMQNDLGSGVFTFLTTPTSANLKSAVTDETGSGALVFATSPTLVTPLLGTPTSGNLSNCTAYPLASLTGAGTGVLTWLATPTSANLAAAVTDETGSGALVFATSPTLVTPALGTPSALVGTNITGTAAGLTAGAVTGFTAGAGVLTGPAVAGVAATLANAQTFTGVKTLTTPIFTGSITGPLWKPASDSTTALQATASNGTTVILNVDSTNSRLGINTSAPAQAMHLKGAGNTYFEVESTSNSIQSYFGAQSGGMALQSNGDVIFLPGGGEVGRATGRGIQTTHIIGTSSTPGIAAGVGAGTSPTVSIAGTDLAGMVTVTTGTLPTGTNAVVATITFASSFAFAAAPYVVLQPANALTATLSGVSMVFVTSTTTTFVITSGTTALTAATAYKWNYICCG